MPITLEPIKNRKFIMKRVYSTKPENKGGFFLLLMSFAGLIMVYGYGSILLDCSKISDIVIVSLVLFAILAWNYYILDEAIWLMFGKEKCEYDDTKIVITKHLKRRKEIPWNEITDISLYSPGLIVELFTYPSLTGTPQGTILIKYGKGKKYKCGVNLGRIKAQKVIEMLKDKMEKPRVLTTGIVD